AGVDYLLEPLNSLNKPTDPSTGWSYHGARWMAPETGRWLTPDPPVQAPDARFMARPWALHPYQYVQQNPVMYWDPDGNDFDPIKYFIGDPIDNKVKEVQQDIKDVQADISAYIA